ncbi:hypothetical protein BRADI_2g28613v3, partial [Brachypodium distachyon]
VSKLISLPDRFIPSSSTVGSTRFRPKFAVGDAIPSSPHPYRLRFVAGIYYSRAPLRHVFRPSSPSLPVSLAVRSAGRAHQIGGLGVLFSFLFGRSTRAAGAANGGAPDGATGKLESKDMNLLVAETLGLAWRAEAAAEESQTGTSKLGRKVTIRI